MWQRKALNSSPTQHIHFSETCFSIRTLSSGRAMWTGALHALECQKDSFMSHKVRGGGYNAQGLADVMPSSRLAQFWTKCFLIMTVLLAASHLTCFPRCPYCNSLLMGNVRGGAWFLHTPYDEQSRQAEAWVESILQDSSKRLVVLEIGAGFNTPTVTRFPMESISACRW